MNPFTFIIDSYNHETLFEARKLEKFEIQLRKFRIVGIFNLRCLANKVTLHLKNQMERQELWTAIIKKAECSLIHNWIKGTNIKINHLQTEIANTKMSLQQKIDEPTFTNLENTIFSNKDKNIPTVQEHPYQEAQATSSPEPPGSWTQWNQYKANPCQVQQPLKSTKINNYANKWIRTNTPKTEHLALENHRRDRYHIIVTADKGVVLVVIDKTEYTTKCEALLQDNSVYQHLFKTHPQLSTQNSLKFCKTTGITITFLKQNTPYSDLKIQLPGSKMLYSSYNWQNNMPIHHIVSACGTATYNTAKFITKILQNYCGKTSSFAKDSTDFIKKNKTSLNKSRRRNISLIWCQCSLHQHTSFCCTIGYQFQNFYLHQFSLMSAWSIQKNLSSIWNSLSPTTSSASIRNSINNYWV